MKLSFTFKNPEEIIKGLREKAATLIRNTGKEMYSQVTARTPVDHGQARANWFCSVNAVNDTVTDSVILDPNRAASAFVSVKAGDQLYISNSTPYILELEHGSSEQAPAGMAMITIVSCASAIESGGIR